MKMIECKICGQTIRKNKTGVCGTCFNLHRYKEGKNWVSVKKEITPLSNKIMAHICGELRDICKELAKDSSDPTIFMARARLFDSFQSAYKLTEEHG